MALVKEALAGILTPHACNVCTVVFYDPPWDTNLGILEDDGPTGETEQDAAPDG